MHWLKRLIRPDSSTRLHATIARKYLCPACGRVTTFGRGFIDDVFNCDECGVLVYAKLLKEV